MITGPVLFVDDEEHIRLSARQSLELADFDVECFADACQVPARVNQGFEGIVITDIRMPGMDGMQLMERLLEIDPHLPIVLITGHGDIQLAVEAMRKGAYNFIEKPFASSHLVEVTGRALEKRALVLEVRQLRSLADGHDNLDARLIGRSPVMADIRRRIRAIADTDADVLITGSTGTGKEVAARALHAESARSGKPFIAINCGALPADLIESELFGHEAGAFPGAIRERYGKFEHARGGTIFLDEIESMPAELQVKLLRVIQDRTVTRLGANDPVELDVRFIAASKFDLETEAQRGKFRPDLLYRLNVVTLHMPDIAQRTEDIPCCFRVSSIKQHRVTAGRRRTFPARFCRAWLLGHGLEMSANCTTRPNVTSLASQIRRHRSSQTTTISRFPPGLPVTNAISSPPNSPLRPEISSKLMRPWGCPASRFTKRCRSITCPVTISAGRPANSRQAARPSRCVESRPNSQDICYRFHPNREELGIPSPHNSSKLLPQG